MSYKKINQRGASLVEILITVSLFAVMVMLAAGMFKNIIEGQRNAIAAQNTQESLRFLFEMISKEIRMAQNSDNESDNGCESLVGGTAVNKLYNTDVNTNGDILYFKNKSENDECVAYYLDNDYRLRVVRGSTDLPVTPDEIKVTKLKFNVVDNDINVLPDNRIQPRVTILIETEEVGSKGLPGQKILMQTTISSRNYSY